MARSIADLVEAAAEGDLQAFEFLVRQTSALVTGIAYNQCGNFELSEDIAQEAFIEAWSQLKALQDPKKFTGWICTIARRRAIDVIRKEKPRRMNRSLGELDSEIPDSRQPNPEDRLTMEQEREWIWGMLTQLPEAYREPLILYYRCDESTREVASALGESESTIRQRIKRGRDLLRMEMNESVRYALRSSLPKATFTTMVVASLPTTSSAAGVASTSVSISKSSGVLFSSVLGSALLGSMIGLAGGIFGTWMSWKSCEYESQQKFIFRQIIRYALGLSVFTILLIALVMARFRGLIENNFIFSAISISIIVVGQVLNFVWIWNCIQGFKTTTLNARARGESVREVIRFQRIQMGESEGRNTANDRIQSRVFQWNAGSWFGGGLGSMAWLIPLSAIAFQHGSRWLAVLALTAFILTASTITLTWYLRNRIHPFYAIEFLIFFMLLMTTVVFLGLQFLCNETTRLVLHWTPWGWFGILIFPAIAAQLWWIQLRSRLPDPARPQSE